MNTLLHSSGLNTSENILYSSLRGKTLSNGTRIIASILLFVLMGFNGIVEAQTVEPFTLNVESEQEEGVGCKSYICKQNYEKDGCRIELSDGVISMSGETFETVFLYLELNLNYADENEYRDEFPSRKVPVMLLLEFENGTHLHKSVKVEKTGQLVKLKDTSLNNYVDTKQSNLDAQDLLSTLVRHSISEISIIVDRGIGLDMWTWKLNSFKTAPTIKAMMQKIVAEQGKKGGVSSNQNSGINSEIHNVIAEQNVTQDGKKGMKIHVDFIINNAKDVPCRAIAYFYDENKNALKDKNDKYNDTGGNVCAGTDLTPSYENTHYSDLTIFIPYEELHIDRGDHNLKFFVRIWKKDGDFVDNGGSEYYQFSYSASKNMENNLSKGYWRTHMNRVMDHFTRWYFGNDVYKGQETTVYYVSMRNGLGVYKWENGTYYWGEWMQGDMNGYGIYICRDGYTLTDCPNCVYYVGNYRNDNRSGKGSCYDEYGNLIYYGDFYNGRPTGTYPTTGNYSSYKFECIEYDNGNKYVGETKDGKRQGYGIFLWKNGEAWYGPWNNGIRDGYGIDLQYNGSITYGRWLNDTYYRY